MTTVLQQLAVLLLLTVSLAHGAVTNLGMHQRPFAARSDQPLLSSIELNGTPWAKHVTVLTRNGVHYSYNNYTIMIDEHGQQSQRWTSRHKRKATALPKRAFGIDRLALAPNFEGLWSEVLNLVRDPSTGYGYYLIELCYEDQDTFDTLSHIMCEVSQLSCGNHLDEHIAHPLTGCGNMELSTSATYKHLVQSST